MRGPGNENRPSSTFHLQRRIPSKINQLKGIAFRKRKTSRVSDLEPKSAKKITKIRYDLTRTCYLESVSPSFAATFFLGVLLTSRACRTTKIAPHTRSAPLNTPPPPTKAKVIKKYNLTGRDVYVMKTSTEDGKMYKTLLVRTRKNKLRRHTDTRTQTQHRHRHKHRHACTDTHAVTQTRTRGRMGGEIASWMWNFEICIYVPRIRS